MSDHDSKYYRKEWMSEDQWDCAKLAARICGGFHHMGKVANAGDGVCCEIFKSDIATFDFDEMTRIVVLAHDACIRVSFGRATRNAEYEGNEYEEHYSRLILHKRQREGSMTQRHPTLEDHIALIRGVAPDPAKLAEPDMFWDCDDPEQPYDSIQELLTEMDYEGEGLVEVQQAIQCPQAAYRFRFIEVEDTDDREIEIEQIPDDQYRELRVAQRVGYAFRALFDARVKKEAERLLEAEGRESLRIRADERYEYIPYRVRARFEREARAALLATIGGQDD